MKTLFEKYDFKIGKGQMTAIWNNAKIFQDGTTPMCRDANGTLWAISGHSHAGEIAMLKGTKVADLKKVYNIKTHFEVGNATNAFDGIPYPEGIRARGSVWPFGLYICPNTNRFFVWFHNETGWNGQGSAYDAFGLCEQPKYDSDFRHVGLMHSDDQGKSWTFDRWVLTAETVCFTEKFNPDGINVLGQKAGTICLGSGDFSMFADPKSDFIYVFYSMIRLDMNATDYSKAWQACDLYVARARKRSDGVIGDFVKYFDGAFCESGTFGKETPIMPDCWHAKVAYLECEDTYIMTSKPIMTALSGTIKGVSGIGGKVMQVSVSKDLVSWCKPQIVHREGKVFGNHYNAVFGADSTNPVGLISGKKFLFLCNHNGSGVTAYPVELVPKSQ